MKKVVMLLVDSLMPTILEDAVRHNTVPALKFLIDRGRYWPNCVTVFPTMTASVDSSLLTGAYPDVHKVPGLIWYDPEERKIVNYINGWKCIFKLGLSHCTRNVLYRLNENHLSKQVSTIFEELAFRGRTSASINAMIHRGTKKHRVRLPFLVDLATGFRNRGDISGPDVMTLGAMVDTEMNRKIPRRFFGFRQVYGMNDRYAVNAVKCLLQSDNPPDFTLAYLPDNDHKVHRINPAHAEEALIQVDYQIQEILNVFNTWDNALHHCVFIIISDHGQTRIGKTKEFNIDLDVLLQSFQVLQLGEDVRNQDLVVANNERMAYIYPLNPDKQHEVISRLMSEARLDVIAWKENQGVWVQEGGSGRKMYFKPGGSVTDPYGSSWSITGEYRVLDLRLNKDTLEYGDYPDGLARLYGALYSQNLPMIVITARPRYEFKSRYYPMHLNGGSHGSLHKYDSLIPVIVAGTDHPVKEPPRLVDMKSLIMDLFEPSPVI
jgi:predicted AlkP superfamily pyrophosphatase or phosphodiesterase